METRPLGRTDIEVSVLCLGTMTWGQQNQEAEAFEQLDYAVANGINFIDTAEMYPVPPHPDTYSRTETIIGNWLAKRKKRDEVVLATKVVGRSGLNWIRGGPRLTRDQILTACDDSLKRLQTAYIDLYQIHWPERKTNFFGRRGYTHVADDEPVPIAETLGALAELVEAGKVRHVGISNETPWGIAEYLRLSRENGLPRIVSIQNPYSLLNRTFEIGGAEFAHRESVGLLAYSPLAFGVLSGKYLGGHRPEGARLTLFGDHFTRYVKPQGIQATEAYVELAEKYGLDPAQMALAWINQRSFLTANIIGATTMAQLRSNIASTELTLPPELCDEIEAIHEANPNPAP